MLESLPEIDDRFFALPRMDSLNAVQQHQQLRHEEKPNLLSLGSGSLEWAVLAGLTSAPELTQALPQQPVISYADNAACVPTVPAVGNAEATQQRQLGSSMADEEVQSRVRSHLQAGAFHPNPSLLAQSLAIPTDPFGYRYPAQ